MSFFSDLSDFHLKHFKICLVISPVIFFLQSWLKIYWNACRGKALLLHVKVHVLELIFDKTYIFDIYVHCSLTIVLKGK